MPEEKRDKDSSGRAELFTYAGLGLQLAATVAIMVYVGYKVDEHFGTAPIWLIICSFFGVFAGLYHFIKTVLKSK